MMALTHGVMGLAAAVVLLPAASEYVSVPLLVATVFLGGIAPDLDLLANHRKTLHYPVCFSALALGLLAAFLLTGSSLLLLLAFFVGAAALHCVSDIFGGSVECEPWNPTTENAVYNHVLGRWHRPRRYVRYSGAPEDFLACLAFALVVFSSAALEPTAELGLLCLVAFAGSYSFCRKRLAEIPALVDAVVPASLRAALPAVRVEETENDGTTVDIRFGR